MGAGEQSNDRGGFEKRQNRNSTSVTLNAFSRVTASVGLMVLLGFGGSWLDRWLGVGFLTITGFVLGGTLMLVGMLYAVKAAEYERRQISEASRASEDKDNRK
ncbi:MAG: AtpZ/AtpI family protein [Pirellula sp.]|jgi:hypothetical protein|nr:AtpZ/AtpI family protein [Pirellula sp.]